MISVSTLGPYQISHKIGEGGMGTVYAARHRSIEREVAIKFLSRACSASPDLVLRFLNEARAAARIDHPGIVQVFDSGLLPDGTSYLIMELLKWESLNNRLRSTGSTLRQSLQVAWQVASAISAAHAAGIVHRDLKPDNIMLVPDPLIDGGERVKILDFGIAKLSSSRDIHTASNVIMGTPRYMSPEQCRGAAHVDDRADVYSLGVVLFEMFAGRPLFIAENPNDYLFAHVLETPPRLSAVVAEISAELDNLVAQLLCKAAPQRPAMQQVTEQLRSLLNNMPIVSIARDYRTQPPYPGRPTPAPVTTTLGQTSGLQVSRRLTAVGPYFRRLAAAGLLCAMVIFGLHLFDPHRHQPHFLSAAPAAVFPHPTAAAVHRAEPTAQAIDTAEYKEPSSHLLADPLADDIKPPAVLKLQPKDGPSATPTRQVSTISSPPRSRQVRIGVSQPARNERPQRSRMNASTTPYQPTKMKPTVAKQTMEALLGE